MKRTKKAIATLTLMGMVATMVPLNAFAATGVTTDRISGTDRFGTAVNVAERFVTANTAILAPAANANLVDALAAAPLAGKDAPILLTDNNTLTQATKDELIKLGVKKVYVVGAISEDVFNEVKAIFGVTEVVQLKGTDRIATAAKISAELTDIAGSFVVGYGALADALSVASFAAANNYSIIVADPDGSLPASEATYKGLEVYTVGGSKLVADIEGATRLAGADRFATNKVVLDTLDYSYDKAYVANGTNAHLVDSLIASSLAGAANAPIILTDPTIYGDVAAAAIHAKLADNAVVVALGGDQVVTDATVVKVAYGITDPADIVGATADVTALETAAAKDLTVEANLMEAEALVQQAKDAVNLVDNTTEKAELDAKVAANERTVTDARSAFDVEKTAEDAAEVATKTAETSRKSPDVTAATTAVVAVKDANKAAAFTARINAIDVLVDVTSISLTKTTDSLTVGGADNLIAIVDPADSTNKDVTWTSSDNNIATVDNTGKVIAIGAGTATITVATVDGNKTASCTVTVENLRILSIDDITFNVVQNDIYNLPSTVAANMNDGKTHEFKVLWQPSVVDTSKLGTYTFEGIVAGYDKSVTLNLNVQSYQPNLNISNYSSITINNVCLGLALNILNNGDRTIAINKIEVYEKGILVNTYDKDALIAANISTDITSQQNWGMSISYKTGIWLDNSYIKYYLESNGNSYDYQIDIT